MPADYEFKLEESRFGPDWILSTRSVSVDVTKLYLQDAVDVKVVGSNLKEVAVLPPRGCDLIIRGVRAETVNIGYPLSGY
jgi:hypothetical protein